MVCCLLFVIWFVVCFGLVWCRFYLLARDDDVNDFGVGEDNKVLTMEMSDMMVMMGMRTCYW